MNEWMEEKGYSYCDIPIPRLAPVIQTTCGEENEILIRQ